MGALMKRAMFLTGLLVLAACGGQGTNKDPETPATPPTTTSAVAETKTDPPAAVKEATPDPTPAPAAAPEKEATPDPCDSTWSCVKVSAGKVEKRTTKLVGDPKIDQTHSKITDGRNAATFDFYSKGAVEILLRRKPGNKNEVVMKSGKGEIVLDRKDGSIDDFSHIGVIAAEQDGAFLVDINYMK
jgi:hypothetical protein